MVQQQLEVGVGRGDIYLSTSSADVLMNYTINFNTILIRIIQNTGRGHLYCSRNTAIHNNTVTAIPCAAIATHSARNVLRTALRTTEERSAALSLTLSSLLHFGCLAASQSSAPLHLWRPEV